MTKKIIYNGNLINWEDTNIHISEKSMWYDFGVYESIKVIQGSPIDITEHVERLVNSAKILDIGLKYSKKSIENWILKLCKVNNIKDALVKIIVLGDTEKSNSINLYIFNLGLTFYPDSYYRKGVSVITYYGKRLFPKAKTIDLLINYVALKKAKSKDSIDALLISPEGYITEGTRSNVFFVKNNVFISPMSKNILDGVVRKNVLEIIENNSFQYKEKNINETEIMNFDECFITSTSSKILPITKINSKKVGDGNVGVMTKKIYSLYRKFEKEQVNIFRQ